MGVVFHQNTLPRGVRAAGFTLIELMVTIAIGGILASVAIPTYKSFKYKAQSAEALMNLGAIAQGVRAYYQAEHWQAGVVDSGEAGIVTGCLPEKGGTSNLPQQGRKTTLDWDEENPTWRDIGFTPGDPLLFNYSIRTCWGEANCSMASWGLSDCPAKQNKRPPNGYNPGCCGHNGLTGGYLARARGQMGSSVSLLTIRFCSNDDNELYVCSRQSTHPGCGLRIAPRRAPSSTVTGWALMLIGLCVTFRRARPGRG